MAKRGGGYPGGMMPGNMNNLSWKRRPMRQLPAAES